MTEIITIEMDIEFIEWWDTMATHIKEDQTTMVIAWNAYTKGKEHGSSKPPNNA